MATKVGVAAMAQIYVVNMVTTLLPRLRRRCCHGYGDDVIGYNDAANVTGGCVWD